jgi:hypothetical protein
MPGTGGDRATKGVLDGAAIKRGIDPSLSHAAGDTRRVISGEDRPAGGPRSTAVGRGELIPPAGTFVTCVTLSADLRDNAAQP